MIKRVLLMVIIVLLFSGYFLLLTDMRNNRAQVNPSPSPTPIDQQWKVEFGDIELLEERLKTLNAAGRLIHSEEISISMDGKRFVVISSVAVDDVEDEP
jgi:hypothetical protein